MGITVAVKVEHLALPKILVSTPPSEQSGILLVPNVQPYGTVKATVKDFIRRNLFIPDDLQVLQAPLFRKLSEKENVEDLYKRYACQVEIDNPELHLDEDNFVFFAREGGQSTDLDDNMRLEEYHILDKTVLQLRRLPQSLPDEGGRIFVETKDGILPLLGVNHRTQVLELKHALERMTGILVAQQLLSSVGRIMHDDFCIKDFDGPYRVCEDSTLDLCKSGDSNSEQAHLRMVINVNIMGEHTFSMVVQGRDLVQSVQQVVEARTGVATWQQRITYSGKVLMEKKCLSEYYIHPECTLQVTIFRSPCKPTQTTVNSVHSRENSGIEEQKPAARKIKLLRTSKGHSNGTITIPVLTTDSVADLRRKVRRTLQPLMERNFIVLRSPLGNSTDNSRTPSKASPSAHNASPSPSKADPYSSSGRRLSRVLSFTGRTFSGPLNNGSPTSKATMPQSNDTPVPSESNKKVVRVLSFRNFSGPLVNPSSRPSQHRAAPDADASSAPLFPPPLSSPMESPTVQGLDSSGDFSKQNPTTPVRKEVVDESRLASDTPLKFVPSKQNVVSPPKTSGGRHSVAHFPLTPQVGNLRGQSPPEPTLPLTAPNTPGSNTSTPPAKNGRLKEAAFAAEKRGLGAWLTDSMHILKEHIKSPFVDKSTTS